MKYTKIQWCHSTINPVMGCDGCELWKPAAAIAAILMTMLFLVTKKPKAIVKRAIARSVGDRKTSEMYRDRERVAEELATRLGLPREQQKQVVDVVRGECKCYAGLLGTFRAGHAGYADGFESPKQYPGRVANAAGWDLPDAKEIQEKPWLKGLPRLIFISDMGDALSASVPFDYLRGEIIENAVSEDGSRHLWLWLTKRPGRMAEFGEWLQNQGISWPHNLVPMTTVTMQRYAKRVDQLRRVPGPVRGLSLEPLFEPVDLDLRGIDWVIVGGGSDVLAQPFHVEWALQLREQCRKAGVALFMKQLGKKPFYQNQPIKLEDKHGGDWAEWPEEWRVRELPQAFWKL
jgi:protein gp37